MNITSTITWLEVIWTIVAIPGAVLWAMNRRSAMLSLRAARRARAGNGRRVYANFAVKETSAWLGIEALFVAMGVLSMLVEPTSSVVRWPSYVITAGLIVTSVFISYMAFQWRAADEAVLRVAREKERDHEDLGDHHP